MPVCVLAIGRPLALDTPVRPLSALDSQGLAVAAASAVAAEAAGDTGGPEAEEEGEEGSDSSSTLSSRADGINRTIKDIGSRRDALNLRLVRIEKRYRAQYTALDVMMSNMTKTSSYLTQQLANLAGSSSTK